MKSATGKIFRSSSAERVPSGKTRMQNEHFLQQQQLNTTATTEIAHQIQEPSELDGNETDWHNKN